MLLPVFLNLSGERFSVTYQIDSDKDTVHAKVQNLAIEQTVEFPPELIPDDDIKNKIIGHVESLVKIGEHTYEATISYAEEITGYELVQLLNVILGNSSLLVGIRVEQLDLSWNLLKAFKGPRFGRAGLRELLGIRDRPLLCTALKPLGSPTQTLAELAYQFALGGIDIIKDDHGLANQTFAPFFERVQNCATAVARANRETGYHCIYAPNISAPADKLFAYARFAKDYGAGALMVSPGLIGFDAMRVLADDDSIALPIIYHPTFQGFLSSGGTIGFSHFVQYGQFARLAGADASIFPNQGGRFAYTREDCIRIAEGTMTPMDSIKPIFPMPGGGMLSHQLDGLLDLYGKEFILLIGGGLHRLGPDLVENSRLFRQRMEQL
jgi:ribulose-bisphosphate carboxylase large chain